MDFFIQNAWAEAAAPPDAGLLNLVMLVVLFVVFYFLLIRPQTKRVKEHKKMVDALAKGDEIMTGGGILGKIITIGDDYVTIEIAPNTQVKVQRQSVSTVIPKGTIKSLN
ncbi:preprotein translocase subunit YajC [Candidatus Halobeggiatoa sp. HSG11]|nr:preprotein translocase subunit YajC [Candidatus Halobeggiatoa sp. HSG11]